VKRLALSLLLVAAVMFPTSLFAASAGAVRGKVLGPDNNPMAGVLVQLRNEISASAGFRDGGGRHCPGGAYSLTLRPRQAPR